MDVSIQYEQRQVTLSSEIILTDDRKTNWEGVELFGFKCPNIYGSKTHIWFLQPEVLEALVEAQNQLLSLDYSVLIVDAWRSYEYQAQQRKKKPNIVASPEKSNHPKGLAIDARMFDLGKGTWVYNDTDTWGDQDELSEILDCYGFVRTAMPREPWHFDFTG